MLTKERLEAIRKRARRATAGPWFVSGDGVIKSQTVVDHKYEEPVEIAEVSFDCNDEGFIAHARQDIPDLVAEVERLRKLAHELLEHYDLEKRTVIDEYSTNRELSLKYLKSTIESYRNEINGGE